MQENHRVIREPVANVADENSGAKIEGVDLTSYYHCINDVVLFF